MAQSIPNEIHSLWIGDRLGPLELVCLKSWIEQGHGVVLWRYEPLKTELPESVEVRDASLIAPRDQILAHRKTGSWALGSDLFRFRLMATQHATWCDLDMLLLKPLDLERPLLFGWEHEDSINCAVLRVPPDSALLRDLTEFYLAAVPIPPWSKTHKKIYYWLRALFGITRRTEEFAWGTFGPRATTYFAQKHGLDGQAEPPEVFYPVPYLRADCLLEAGSEADSMLTERSVGVHLWGSQIRPRIMAGDFARESWVARQCERLGVPIHPVESKGADDTVLAE